MAILLEFQSVELGWWLEGPCKCVRNTKCEPVLFAEMAIGDGVEIVSSEMDSSTVTTVKKR